MKSSPEESDTDDKAVEESQCEDEDSYEPQESVMDSDSSSSLKVPQMRISLTNLAREADRFGFQIELLQL